MAQIQILYTFQKAHAAKRYARSKWRTWRETCALEHLSVGSTAAGSAIESYFSLPDLLHKKLLEKTS